MTFWATLKNISFNKIYCFYFLVKIGTLFILTSGHTALILPLICPCPVFVIQFFLQLQVQGLSDDDDTQSLEIVFSLSLFFVQNNKRVFSSFFCCEMFLGPPVQFLTRSFVIEILLHDLKVSLRIVILTFKYLMAPQY